MHHDGHDHERDHDEHEATPSVVGDGDARGERAEYVERCERAYSGVVDAPSHLILGAKKAPPLHDHGSYFLSSGGAPRRLAVAVRALSRVHVHELEPEQARLAAPGPRALLGVKPDPLQQSVRGEAEDLVAAVARVHMRDSATHSRGTHHVVYHEPSHRATCRRGSNH